MNSTDPPIRAGTSGTLAVFLSFKLTRGAPAVLFCLGGGEAEEEQKEGYPHQ